MESPSPSQSPALCPSPLLTLSVKMTPNFQIWYLTSMDMSLCGDGDRRRESQMPEGLAMTTSPARPPVPPTHQVSSPGGGSGWRPLCAVISSEARSMPSSSAIRSRPKMSPCLSRTCTGDSNMAGFRGMGGHNEL